MSRRPRRSFSPVRRLRQSGTAERQESPGDAEQCLRRAARDLAVGWAVLPPLFFGNGDCRIAYWHAQQIPRSSCFGNGPRSRSSRNGARQRRARMTGSTLRKREIVVCCGGLGCAKHPISFPAPKREEKGTPGAARGRKRLQSSQGGIGQTSSQLFRRGRVPMARKGRTGAGARATRVNAAELGPAFSTRRWLDGVKGGWPFDEHLGRVRV